MNVAIIPARGGSKRIPSKNIRLFAGKPIIAYTIETARASGLFDRIIVSTDSPEIARVAKQWGAEVPFLRPAALADDYTPTADVVLHAVDWLKQNGGCDYGCCIYPTAPFLQQSYLRQGWEALQRTGVYSAMSITRFAHPIQRAVQLDEDGRVAMLWPEHRIARSQDLPVTFHDVGQFYWFQADFFLREKTFLLSRPVGIVIPGQFIQDIDTPEDWEIAEQKYRLLAGQMQATTSPRAELPATALPLVLGTAQLGFTYGIANRLGKPGARDANTMLCAAWAGGIHCFDTAQAYGDSEYVLGDFFAGSYGFSDAQFISKLHPDVNTSDAGEIRRHVEESLRRLKSTHLWALLLHREEHLNAWDQVLGRTLRELQHEGLVKHLGISCYRPDYAQKALANPDLSIVEVPANIFDRRVFRAGLLDMARDLQKLVLVRSVLLQGLALLRSEQIPNSLPAVAQGLATLHRFCATHHLNPREFAYDYARAISPNALIVLGAESAEQVAQNCLLPRRPPLDQKLIELWDEAWPEDKPELYDPARWQDAFQAGPIQFPSSNDPT